MRLLMALLLVIVLSAQAGEWLNEEKVCEGNRFVYLSTHVLGMQTALKQTFQDITKTIKVEEVIYQEEIFRTYRVFNIVPTLTYNQGKQDAFVSKKDVLRVSNGTVRISFSFNWTKTQLGQSFEGSGTSSVTSDIISYEKTLITNSTHELQWELTYSEPLHINTGFALNTFQPYRKNDYEVVSDMLNKLKNNQTTVKDNFLKAINAKLQTILAQKVFEDETIKFQKSIKYQYNSYRGPFIVDFTHTLMGSALTTDGLSLHFSQVIKGYDDFQCGEAVPFEPDQPSIYGGIQEIYSNSLIKSTFRYAVGKQRAIDVNLTQEFWESRAFQFFVGDLHDVMPTATKKLETMIPIQGTCRGLDDPVFSFGMKSIKTYEAKVNFECKLRFNNTEFIKINLVATYEIAPKLSSKQLDWQLINLAGTPAFIETDPFKIEFQELAEFMVSETILLAKGAQVYGSRYKMKYPRKFPSLLVKKNYLLLYDGSAIKKNS